MFGYVRARQDTLSAEDQAAYEAAYCGLCHAMGMRYGKFSRLFLNYDFVFLSMLLSPPEASCACRGRRCIRHPLHGKTACDNTPWLALAGGESVILTHWKLRDTVADSGTGKGLAARLALLLLRSGYRKAQRDCPVFDQTVSDLLMELRALERENCPSIDRTADRFARLLQAAAPSDETGEQNRPLGQLLYHLGRWIYLIDAVDDLEEDRAAGAYNPVAARFPDWTEEDRSYLRRNMDHSLALMGAAFQLLSHTPWTPVIENIIYSGLPGVEEMVFSGQWREHQKKYRRNGL